jgi:hypothetical protein
MKKILPFLIALAIGILTGFFLAKKTSEPDPAFWVAKAKYDEAAAAADLQHRADQFVIKTAKDIIAEQDGKIAALTAAKPSPAEAAKDKEIAALNAKVTALEAQGDLAGALAAAKAENTTWAEKFSLAERRHQDSLSALNNAWQVKFDAQVDISNTWEAAYNREHGLRLTAESLSDRLIKKAKVNKYLQYGGYAVLFIAGHLSGRK